MCRTIWLEDESMATALLKDRDMYWQVTKWSVLVYQTLGIITKLVIYIRLFIHQLFCGFKWCIQPNRKSDDENKNISDIHYFILTYYFFPVFTVCLYTFKKVSSLSSALKQHAFATVGDNIKSCSIYKDISKNIASFEKCGIF